MSSVNQRSRASEQDYRDVSEFLFREARLLDAGDFHEWVALLSEDIHYRLVNFPVSALRVGGGESERGGEVALMDENLSSLRARVQQLVTPAYTIAENPRSSMRRFVSNISVEVAPDPLLLIARSNVLIYQTRLSQGASHLISLSRVDTLRRQSAGLLLSRRSACLDEPVISARNLSTVF